MPSLRLTELIRKKRDGGHLDPDDIQFFIQCVKGLGPSIRSSDDGTKMLEPAADPSQIGAMLMAIYMNGMDDEETRSLTTDMKNSGYVFSWPEQWKHLVVDKHSTGGVGDKISLVLAPALAAVGLKVPMISGRTLAHTGGTLNKMESIPGFCVEQTPEAVVNQVRDIGCCIIGQTDEINPADKTIYRIRDITATVGQLSLITASIVSKKLAEGLGSIVYDVKFGKGSIFKTEEEALDMAKRLVTASCHETKSCALFTEMGSPIGHEIGNTREVLESVWSMKGRAPVDVLELVQELGSELMLLSGTEVESSEAKSKIREVLSNGKALEKFYEMLKRQGVSEGVAKTLCYGDDPADALPKPRFVHTIAYHGPNGYVTDVDASALAVFWKWLSECSSDIDLTAGLTLIKHVGDEIRTGDDWLMIHHNCSIDEEKLDSLHRALEVSNERKSTRRRVYKKIYVQEGAIKIVNVP